MKPIAMRRALTVLALLGSGLAGPNLAQATSVGRMPPHDPILACAALDDFVTAIGKGTLPQGGLAGEVSLFDDANGHLVGNRREGFVAGLTSLNGKPDRTPVRLGRVVPMGGDGTTAVYLVELVRDAWVPVSWEQDAMQMSRPVSDPHWEAVRSYWLATFWSSRLQTFRQAGELWPLLRGADRASACLNLVPH